MNYSIKILIILMVINLLLKFYKIIKINYFEIKENSSKISNYINSTFYSFINNEIKIGIYSYYLKNGGRARITSILLNYFSNIKIFKVYLLTNSNKDENEYKIKENIKRISMNKFQINNLII